MNRLQYRRFLIGPKIGILGQKIFPHTYLDHYLDNSHVNEMLRETLEQQGSVETSQTNKSASRENSPSFTHRNRQTEKLITKLLSTNLNEIHKNYFKYLSINEKNKYHQQSKQQTELEDNSAPNLNAESSNSIESNVEGEYENKTAVNSNNFFMQRPNSKVGSRTESRTKDAHDQTSIIYHLSKIHSNNKKRNYLSSNLNHPSNTNKKSNNEYHEIEMKTLALVDFKEEKF